MFAFILQSLAVVPFWVFMTLYFHVLWRNATYSEKYDVQRNIVAYCHNKGLYLLAAVMISVLACNMDGFSPVVPVMYHYRSGRSHLWKYIKDHCWHGYVTDPRIAH